MERLYKVSEVAKMLNVSTVAVRKWIKSGKLKAKRVGKLWMIPEYELKCFLGEKPLEIRAVIYARVSSHKLKRDNNLDRQIERLRRYRSARGYKVVDVITDVASGLKENRNGLQRLFSIVEKHQVDVVVVEFKDRLTRFGFNYLKRYFESHGVKVEVVEEIEKGYMEELVEDFVSIVISFAARIYGKRSQKYRKIKKVVEEVISDD
ncbi:MAG: IS607 family transposase [Desulfurococcales archaeon]|nr:IS607 family transposase [Desulfurococcales archaeon]